MVSVRIVKHVGPTVRLIEPKRLPLVRSRTTAHKVPPAYIAQREGICRACDEYRAGGKWFCKADPRMGRCRLARLGAVCPAKPAKWGPVAIVDGQVAYGQIDRERMAAEAQKMTTPTGGVEGPEKPPQTPVLVDIQDESRPSKAKSETVTHRRASPPPTAMLAPTSGGGCRHVGAGGARSWAAIASTGRFVPAGDEPASQMRSVP